MLLAVMESVANALGGYGYRGWIVRTRRVAPEEWHFRASHARRKQAIVSNKPYASRANALEAARQEINVRIRHGNRKRRTKKRR
jgi:hypothetical protein